MSNVYPLIPDDESVSITVEGDAPAQYDEASNTTSVELEDGSVAISYGPPRVAKETKDFNDNIAELLNEAELSTIAENLLLAIEQDDQSRQAWLQNMSNGISLLGLEIKNPRGASASAATPGEGISTVDHPLLLEADLRFQANARGELLPSDGPVKIRNDGEQTAWTSRLADALEKDLNHYLTVTAEEYYPDTDRMLLMLGFCGIAFKKGYHCPIKRRPVIESIDAKDLIVSNASTNLAGAGRVTHRIMMRPSIIKRMQLLGAYRTIALPSPGTPVMKDPVGQKIDLIQGIAPQTYTDAADQDRELYECYCEIEVPGFEHLDKNKEETGLPLPYKVTIDREARRVLAIYRNWDEEDPICMPRNRIVAYIFVPGIGFYGIGLLNILGNATKAVTAAWRLMIDAGMFSNFPGFLYLKSLAKQLTNQFRIPPGGGMPIDTIGNDIRASVMPLPYKDASPVFMQLIENVVQTAQRVGGTAETSIGEGKQDAPVGTTLALIEQATKIMSAVHKRLHQAQGQEFGILKELLSEDPSALWRHNKKSAVLKCLMEQAGLQQAEQADDDAEERHNALFLEALNDLELIPRADPNTSSQTERYLKATALKQVQQGNPRISQDEVDLRILHTLGIDDAESLFLPPPPPGTQMPPDPNQMAAQAKLIDAQSSIQDSQTKQLEASSKARIAELDLQIKQQVAASNQRIAELGVQREAIIHEHDRDGEARRIAAEQQQQEADRQHDLAKTALAHRADFVHTALEQSHKSAQDAAGRQHDAAQEALGRQHDHIQGALERQHDLMTQPEPGPKPKT